MMKKDLINKNVVRAISLGLSAVMLTTPMTALANPGEGTPVDPDTDVTDAEVTQNEVVANAIDDAQDTISNDKPGDNVVIDTPDPEVPDSEGINVVLPSTGKTITNTPDAVEAANATDLVGVTTTVGEGEGAEEITYKDVIGEAVEATEDTEESNTGLLGANADLADAEDALSDVADAEAEAKKDAAEASTIIGEINTNNTTVADEAKAAQDAADKADEALKEAQAATTEAAAQDAVNKAEEAFKEATAAQAAAQTAYDANVQKLADAEAKLAEAEQALKDAKDAEDTTVAELAAAHEAVSKAVADAEALKAQVDADAKALADSEENALKVAYDNMMAQAVSKQYTGKTATAEDADNDGIGDEFTTEFGSESASSAYWAAADAYFELYLKYIYGDDYVSGKWEKNNKTLDNPQTAYDAEVDNTFIVKYLDDNGVEQTAYYNYHTALDKDIDNDGVLDVKKGDITIYEKKKGSAWTEEVWGTETEEFVDTRLVEKTRTEQQEMSETTSEDALSIDNGDGTYTKLSDVQKDSDVVLTTESNTDGEATSVLVKDDNSQLLDSEETALAQNQKVVEGTSEDSYSVGTITTYTYGTKEVRVDYTDRIGSYDNLVQKYNEWLAKYPEEDGYRVEIVFDNGFGDDDPITLEQAKGKELGSILGAMWDCGFELKAYQTVEDTNNIVSETQQQVIVKTTTATVATTTQKTVSDTAGDRGRAERAAKAKVQELGLAEGTYSISYKTVWDGPFDKDCKYTITYNEVTTSTQQIKTEKYSATEYNTNTIETTRTWMEDVTVTYEEEETFINTREKDVLLEESVEYEYWTERRNTSNDDEVKAAIDAIEKSLADYAAKKDAAAVALAAALQAKADVEKAQLALDDLEIDDSAYQTALEDLKLAQADYEKAAEDLEKADQAVEDAEQDYKDAAAELGRFIPDPSTGGESGGTTGGEGGTTGGTTPTVPVVPGAEIAEGGAVVTPVATGAGAGAGAAVVDIEDEETPLAAGIDNGNGNGDANGGDGEEVLVAGAEEDETAIVAIEDEETPLAAGSGADGKMSWWWLLIVALLGATGYKMYKDHQKKKEEAAQEA